MQKFYLFLFAFILFTVNLVAQNFDSFYNQSTAGNCLVKTDNNSYLVGGYGYSANEKNALLIKYNQQGNNTLIKNYANLNEITSLFKNSSNSYTGLFQGFGTSTVVANIDSMGNIISQNTIKSNANSTNFVYEMAQQNNYFIATGYYYQNAFNYFVTRINEAGDSTWYTPVKYNLGKIITLDDDNFVAITTNGTNISFITFNSNTGLQTDSIGFNPNLMQINIASAIADENKNIYITGDITNNNKNQGFVMKFANYTHQWTHKETTPFGSSFHAVTNLCNNGIAVGGYLSTSSMCFGGCSDIYVIELSQFGQKIVQKQFDYAFEFETANQLIFEPDNNLLITGGSGYSDFIPGPERLYLIKQNMVDCAALNTNEAKINDINIYPTITHNTVTINASNSNGFINNITLYNPIGQIVKNITTNNSKFQSISLANMPNAVYLIKVKTNTNTITQKIIKY